MNILVCGVGGQGVLLFSEIVAHTALAAGLDVKKSEVHGMAQRGGSVTTHIRFGNRIYSPLIEEGTADIVAAFEKLEALRYLHFLSPSGILLYDPLRIEPLPVQIGIAEKMPDDIINDRISNRTQKSYAVRAFELACQMGNPRIQNTIMLGAASRFLGLPQDLYRQVISVTVKPNFVELNLKAFAAGVELIPPRR